MKAKILLGAILLFTFNLQAEVCTAVIKDHYGSTLERHDGQSYNRDAACSEAMYQCNRSLSDARSNGRYYDAVCEIESFNPWPNPNPYPNPNPGRGMCQTDLVDQNGRLLRTFSGYGQNEYEACSESDRFCNEELYRSNQWGMRCITRGRNPNPNPYPNPNPPRRNKTESCQANRYDPAGMFIQTYMATETGPMNSDVRGMACQRAMSFCQSELRGRQFCNIAR